MRLPAKPHTLFFLLAILLLIAPEAAHAQLNFFSPVPGDKSIQQFLRPLFGSLFGGGASTFEQVIGLFNGAVLTIGGILVAYTLVAGTMQTAHDGEMLGKRWSSMWIPIRTAMGVSLVVPINGGYCVAQMIVAWMVMQGVGLADMVWSQYTGLSFTAQGMNPTSPLPAVEDLARGLLRSHVCMAAHNQISTRAGETSNLYSVTTEQSGMLFGNPTQLKAECGAVSYRFSESIVVSSGPADPFGVSIDQSTLQQIATAVNQAHITATGVMSGQMQAIAQGIVNGTPTSAATLGQFQTAIENYQRSVTQAAANSAQSNGSFAQLAQSAGQDGWIMAGAWFMRAVSLQDAVSTRVSQTPNVSAPSNFNSSQEQIKHFYARMESFLAYTPNQFGISNEAAARNDGGSEGLGLMQPIKRYISDKVLSLVKLIAERDPARHPLMSLKDFGDWVMTVSMSAMAGGLVLLTGLGTMVVGTGNTAGPMMWGNLLMLFFVPLFAFGAGIAIYLPFVPFLLFFGAAIGWLLIVAEAIIAAPMWAVMHLSPNGDDLMGSAKQGYMLILGLMLRPALMIFGLICSLLAVEVVIRVFNYVFFPTMKATMGDSFVGLGSLIAMVGIYFGTMVSLFHKLFGLIHLVPDQIMRWIGGDSSNLGHTAQEIQGRGQSQMGAAIGGLTAGGQQAGSLASNYRQQTAANLQNRLQAQQTAMQEKASALSTSNDAIGAMAGANAKRAQADDSGSPAEHVASLGENMAAYETNAATAQNFADKANKLENLSGQEKAQHPLYGKAAGEQGAQNLARDIAEYKGLASKHSGIADTAANNARKDLDAIEGIAQSRAAAGDMKGADSAAMAGRDASNMIAASRLGGHSSFADASARADGFQKMHQNFSAAASAPAPAQQTQEQNLQFPTLDGQGSGGPSDQPPPQTGRESA